MIKDLLVAIALGAILGFGVTGGYFALTRSGKNNSQVQPTPIVSVIPTQTEETGTEPVPENINQNLNITSPKNESVSSVSKISLKGTSKPDSVIVIKTPLKTYNFTVNQSGSFSADIELESGINIIKISAIDTDDNQTDTQLFVTYSTSKF